MNPRILPIVMIALSIGAGFVYALFGDWRHSLYWFAAALLNATVTF